MLPPEFDNSTAVSAGPDKVSRAVEVQSPFPERQQSLRINRIVKIKGIERILGIGQD
jgi:hypothetical protein